MSRIGRAPIRILLVDDHQSMLDGLEKLIESESPRMAVVGKATSRAEVFALARERNPDVILLDIFLRDEKSTEFLPQLLGEAQAHVIILTSSPDRAEHAEAILRGARGVIVKTEPASVIFQAIEKVHGGGRWHDDETDELVLSRIKEERGQRPDPETEKIASLNPREIEVIRTIVDNPAATNREIADRLNISESTLKNHITAINAKLGVKRRIDLFLYATQHAITPPPG
jgi:DNA-binding NarL/FixJ family response regulator